MQEISNNEWRSRLGENQSADQAAVIHSALELAEQAHSGQTRVSGEPYISHSLAVAEILSSLRMDHETICAALLHDVVEDTDVSLTDICDQFGEAIAGLVDGATKLDNLRDLSMSDAHIVRAQAESLRKMLLAMAQDVRVVLIKLADRLHNMRTLSHLSADKQQRIATETMEIFAPLANRLGIWQIKWELEDLAFRILDAETYHRLAKQLESKRRQRESMIEQAISLIQKQLLEQGMQANLKGRPKHIYSIWRKMQRKDLPFDQLFDVQAIRILVDDVTACYTALGIVHGQWKHIPQEFDDYIANPKENGYQSLHTAVIGPGGQALEVQIRTAAMHQYAEYGVAAHWRYKEQASHDERAQQEINWLRQMLEWKSEESHAEDFIDRFKAEVFQERVYVLTPQGNIIDLQSGSTPIDFAYHVHTQVGHRCRGARVNGKMVPLTTVLENGDKVEILTAKEGGPSRDWLNVHLGYSITARARSGMRQWFRQQDYERNLHDGRAQLEKELARVGLKLTDAKDLPAQFNFKLIDDLYAAVGRGEISPIQLIHVLQPQILQEKNAIKTVHEQPTSAAGQDIIVEGVGKLLTQIARCCKPVPYEAIVGFTTRGSGVRIHRQDCSNMLNLDETQQQRLISVAWAQQSDSRYTVNIEITAYDRSGLLSDVTNVLAKEGMNVLAVNSFNDDDGVAHMKIAVEISQLDQLMRVLNRVSQLPSVLQASRESQ